MPITIPVALPTVAVVSSAMNTRDGFLAGISNRDIVAVSMFSKVGPLAAILPAVWLPLSEDLAAVLN